MGSPADLKADLIEMELHGVGVGPWHHDGCASALCGADSPEQIGVLVALVGRLDRSCSLACPLTDQGVLLADASFILEPNLDRFAGGNFTQVSSEGGGEVFL